MVFIIFQIQNGAISKSCLLSDIYAEFSSGKIDAGLLVSNEYLECLGAGVEMLVEPKKTELIHVSLLWETRSQS